ncbi:MAG: esterase-like activity of phytase family protein [Planctomycetota bacterium]
MRLPRPSLASLVLALAVAPAAAGEPPLPTVRLAGTLTLPATAADGEPLTGLSGVTWLGDDRYAAVLDNSDQLLTFRLAVSRGGVPEAVSDLRIVRLSERHDYEDVAPCPPVLAKRIADRRSARGDAVPATTLLVCEEDTPAIRAIDLDRGDLLGIVPIPARFASRRANRGLEALASDPDGCCIWTANEEALPADGPAASIGRSTVVRIARITVPGATHDGGDAEFAYAVDPPHAFAPVFTGEPLTGLVALAALGDGRLLALERSAAPGLPPFKSRITSVDTSRADDVSGLDDGLAQRPGLALEKTLLWEDALGCNLEGLCLGPTLADGRRLLVALADNGGLGTPTQLVTLVLTQPVAALDVSAVGAAAALAGAALLVLRLTSPSPCSTR